MNCLFYRAKRSWFANFRSEREKEEEVVVVFRDKSFQELKGSIKQAFTVSMCVSLLLRVRHVTSLMYRVLSGGELSL